MKNLLKEKMDKQERCIGSLLTTGGTEQLKL